MLRSLGNEHVVLDRQKIGLFPLAPGIRRHIQGLDQVFAVLEIEGEAFLWSLRKLNNGIRQGHVAVDGRLGDEGYQQLDAGQSERQEHTDQEESTIRLQEAQQAAHQLSIKRLPEDIVSLEVVAHD